ncbi:hypothetical protein FRB90_004035 [Tulasnella sp. 427]|nr:hypothetical protein FRB90_004035 [Tulasnella sp. 427]
MPASTRAQIDRPLNFMNGGTGELRRLSLQTVPGLFDPRPYGALESLRLVDCVRVRYSEILPWLQTGTTLETLHLENLKWLDSLPPPASNNEVSVNSNTIKKITLIANSEQTGLTNILYYLNALVRLHTASGPDFARERLATRLAPLIQQTTISWASTFEDDEEEQALGFQISLTTQGESQPSEFLSFIRKATGLANQPTSIYLDVHDSLSGATRRTSATGAIVRPSSWPAASFEHIGVTDVEAEALTGYLGELKDLLIQNLQPTFPLLNSIHIRYLTPAETGLRPRRLARQGLDGLVEDISRAYKQTEVDEQETKQAETEIAPDGEVETHSGKDEAEGDEAEDLKRRESEASRLTGRERNMGRPRRKKMKMVRLI